MAPSKETRFNQKEFAALLEQAIGHRSINQYALHCGVSATYISKLLRRMVVKPPGVDILRKLADKAYNDIRFNQFMQAAGYLETTVPAAQASESGKAYPAGDGPESPGMEKELAAVLRRLSRLSPEDQHDALALITLFLKQIEEKHQLRKRLRSKSKE